MHFVGQKFPAIVQFMSFHQSLNRTAGCREISLSEMTCVQMICMRLQSEAGNPVMPALRCSTLHIGTVFENLVYLESKPGGLLV